MCTQVSDVYDGSDLVGQVQPTDLAEFSDVGLRYTATECGKSSALRLLCREIVRTNTPESVQIEIVDFRRTLLGVVESATSVATRYRPPY